MKPWVALTTVVIVGVSATVLDQVSKAVPSVVGGTTYLNPGLSLGVVDGSAMVLSALMVLTLVVATLTAVRWARNGRVSAVAVGLAAGGAASNALDRLAFGSVRDVLPVGPVVVNLADALVVIGVVWIVWSLRHPAPEA